MSTSNENDFGVCAILEKNAVQRTSIELFTLKDRVAVITGGQGGLGLEMALAYAQAGTAVYCIDLAAKPSDQFKHVQKFIHDSPALVIGREKSTQSLKGRLEYVSCDVTKQENIWNTVRQIADKEGRLDICVASAGVLKGADVLEYPAADFQKVMDVNVNGALFTAQAAGRAMVKHNSRGSIILLAGMAGNIANKDMHTTAFNASKAAVIQMARSIASELGSKGIRCNALSPGYVYTEMTKEFLHDNPNMEKEWRSQNPLNRIAKPQELQGMALFLASDASSFCTGSNMLVDGGDTAW
ncbi:NAD(P)-binding protein [Pholiota conissans]|uniref:NAD(P)-binding protein n=1 Tax=Pholiota conissans TaxID=109636 RepID=A0A9P5Z1G0_9AGAR|nr:NAD(P)-binding protein [Pholiota conissans]